MIKIISALQISGSFPILEGNGILKIPTVTVTYVNTTPFRKHYFDIFRWAEFCARSDIFFQNCAATNFKAVQLFQSHGKCRSVYKITPSGKSALRVAYE